MDAMPAAHLDRGKEPSMSLYFFGVSSTKAFGLRAEDVCNVLAIRLLSVKRVKPPVPGNTPNKGTSGNETAELPSSMR